MNYGLLLALGFCVCVWTVILAVIFGTLGVT